MTSARILSWICGVAILGVLVSQSASAVSPAFIVLHGAGLQTPVVIRPGNGGFMFMWATYENERTIPSGLQGKRYFDYDVYWGNFTTEEITPEAASQHGRLYLPTADQPLAIVVVTEAYMRGDVPGSRRASSRPIPSQLDGFLTGRALTLNETADLAAAGVPIK